MSDLAATHCDNGISSGNNCGGILPIILILCLCGNGNGLLGGNDCNGSDNGCSGIILILLLLCSCGNGNGFF